MKKILSCLLLWLMMNGLHAQGAGVNFINGLSWSQVLEKAKAENKYVFVDCYTTWCVPCKKMEAEVYSRDAVGQAINDKFICVKYQIDSTPKDPENIRASYADAKYMSTQYPLLGYPTMLFFAPDGKMIHQMEGNMDANAFVNRAIEVLNPENNYYTFLEEYKKGTANNERIPLMAIKGAELKDTANAYPMARQYIKTFNGIRWLNPESIEFLARFTRTNADAGFNIFLKYADTINSIMADPDYAQSNVYRVIYRANIPPSLKDQAKVDWIALQRNVEKKYGKYYSDRVIASFKITWNQTHKNWEQYSKALADFFDIYGYPIIEVNQASSDAYRDLVLNNNAWELFKFSNDRQTLKRALVWSSKAIAIRPDPNWMDTFANLLYKIGDTKMAIDWEETASKLDPADKSIKRNLAKMKQGIPTWDKIN